MATLSGAPCVSVPLSARDAHEQMFHGSFGSFVHGCRAGGARHQGGGRVA